MHGVRAHAASPLGGNDRAVCVLTQKVLFMIILSTMPIYRNVAIEPALYAYLIPINLLAPVFRAGVGLVRTRAFSCLESDECTEKDEHPCKPTGDIKI